MIKKILREIADPKEYKLALRVLDCKAGTFDEEEKAELVELYKKYLRDVKDEVVQKALLLMDTAGVEGLAEAEMKALLEERNLELLADIGMVTEDPIKGVEEAKAAVSRVLHEGGNACLRAALGRVVLDKLAAQSPVTEHMEEINSLSRFLRSCEDETLYQGSILALEVKRKWIK